MSRMNFAGENPGIQHYAGQMQRRNEEDDQFKKMLEYVDETPSWGVSPGQANTGLSAPMPTDENGKIMPEFEYPMMDPRRGPSARDKWQFQQMADPSSVVPLT